MSMSATLFKSLRGNECSCVAHALLHNDIHMIHSEAFREACDIVIDIGSNVQNHTRRTRWTRLQEKLVDVADEIPRGTSVYVKADSLPYFFDRIFPRLQQPVVLVSGDSDYGGVADFLHHLRHPNLMHWFAQNCEVALPVHKLTRIPIGLDNPVFTTFEKKIGQLLVNIRQRRGFRSWQLNERGDQAGLARAAEAMPANREKPLRVLCTFHQFERIKAPNLHERGREARAEAYSLLKDNDACYFVNSRVAQQECWSMHADFAFEVSPVGQGLDCHRTWEALFLNTIPIVKTSPLDLLYSQEDFPVVVVKDWREINRDSLRRWHAQLAPRVNKAMREKLQVPYWRNKLASLQRTARKQEVTW